MYMYISYQPNTHWYLLVNDCVGYRATLLSLHAVQHPCTQYNVPCTQYNIPCTQYNILLHALQTQGQPSTKYLADCVEQLRTCFRNVSQGKGMHWYRV